MTTQYWVGEFFVDLTRNQITRKEQSQTVPPKALAVLTCLAKNANKVVSHEEILSSVWSNAVVSPNTLQRSIAQLRKVLAERVLSEGSQYQSYIKTHAKQGYSLECKVRWQDNSDIDSEPTIDIEPGKPTGDVQVKSHRSVLSQLTLFITFVIAAMAFINFYYLTPEPPLKLSIKEIRLLTATDKKEYSGIYNPDGQFVVFQRYSEEFCKLNNIWAKNADTQQETQLTKKMGAYGSHSFSKDGNELVFIESNRCEQPITQKRCYKLMTLDFQQALTSPQSPSVLMECKNSRIIRPRWLNNNNIMFMQEDYSRWKLSSYSITENKSTVIYEMNEGNLIYFDYSAKDDLIALSSIHSDGNQYIEILKPDGQILSSHKVKLPEEITPFKTIYPNFIPESNQLIFSTGRRLFTLSYEGEITNISLPLDRPMGSPIFHPEGKRMLVIQGHYDSDIATMPLADIKLLQTDKKRTETSNNYSVIERSFQGEDFGQFQPGGKLIAFKSARSGEQLWITEGNNPQQISNFPIDSYIYDMDWAADGKSILVNVNKQLNQIFLNSSSKPISFPHPIERLFQWNSEHNTALLITRIKGIKTFIEANLNNGEFNVITDKKVSWALKTDDGQLIYTDQMEQFWQQGAAEYQLIEALEAQGSDKRFITKNNIVYGINEQFQMWSYDLNQNSFEIIGNVPKRIDYLTDINQTNILLSLRIEAKKEVAELTLN